MKILLLLAALSADIETTCGDLNRLPTPCYPTYNVSPIARITNGTGGCTAWRVGPGDKMITNAHCVGNLRKIWFDYTYTACDVASSLNTPEIFDVNEIIYVNNDLDVALFTVVETPELTKYGYFEIETEFEAQVGDKIYIAGHGEGLPKTISVESDLNFSGFCEIDSNTEPLTLRGRKYTEYGYYCDTTGGSSGSPIVDSATGKVVGLHHTGGCYNHGTKMTDIWPKIKNYFRDPKGRKNK